MSFRLFQRAPAVGPLSIFCAYLFAGCVPSEIGDPLGSGGYERRGRRGRHRGHDRERGRDGSGRD